MGIKDIMNILEIKDSQSDYATSLSWILAESSNEIYVE